MKNNTLKLLCSVVGLSLLLSLVGTWWSRNEAGSGIDELIRLTERTYGITGIEYDKVEYYYPGLYCGGKRMAKLHLTETSAKKVHAQIKCKLHSAPMDKPIYDHLIGWMADPKVDEYITRPLKGYYGFFSIDKEVIISENLQKILAREDINRDVYFDYLELFLYLQYDTENDILVIWGKTS